MKRFSLILFLLATPFQGFAEEGVNCVVQTQTTRDFRFARHNLNFEREITYTETRTQADTGQPMGFIMGYRFADTDSFIGSHLLIRDINANPDQALARSEALIQSLGGFANAIELKYLSDVRRNLEQHGNGEGRFVRSIYNYGQEDLAELQRLHDEFRSRIEQERTRSQEAGYNNEQFREFVRTASADLDRLRTRLNSLGIPLEYSTQTPDDTPGETVNYSTVYPNQSADPCDNLSVGLINVDELVKDGGTAIAPGVDPFVGIEVTTGGGANEN